MKEQPLKHIILIAMILAVFGIAYANQSDPADAKKISTPVASEEVSQNIILAGTINESSQLVDEEGQSFKLSNTLEGMKVQALVGKKVEVKGTVMEKEGENIIDITEYKVLD